MLVLHLVKNDGADFGIGADQRMFFIVFTLGAPTAALIVFGMSSATTSATSATA